MASRKENLKSLFSNTRTRVIIIFTAALMIFAVTIGYIKFRTAGSGPVAGSELTNAPTGIQSIPGVLEPTAQYAKLQEEQNLTQAQKAQSSGGSAIPTIIRTQALGEGVGVVGSKGGQSGGVGFTTLAQADSLGEQKEQWLLTLKKGSCSKQDIDAVMSEGAQLSDLKEACSCVQLKDNGINLKELDKVCQCKELRASGYNARDLREIGYTAGRLRDCGFDACELKGAGFSAQEMKDGGYSDGELKGAGFSEEDISKASGLPAGIAAADVLKAGCNVESLNKLRKAGVSAAAIRRISGCSVDQMKAAGFSAKDLNDAGLSAADLKRARFSPDELKNAGFTARDLLNAGLSPEDLAKVGYTSAQIKAAQNDLPPGITPDDVKAAGCDVDTLKKEKAAGVSAASIKKYAGCSATVLKAAGFSDDELANAGFSPKEISAAITLSDKEIKDAGCTAEQLKKLFEAGVSAKKIKDLNGCSAEALKNAGYDPVSLADAGYTPEELLKAGFTSNQLKVAGLNPAEVMANSRSGDCSVESLKKAKAAGISVYTIKQTLGCSAKALKEAGYSAKELKDGGFTAAELKDAGFSARDLKVAGFSPKELKDAGFTANELKDAGFSAKELKDAGYSAKDLKDAGYSAKDLKDAGFSAKDLKDAGYSAKDLKDAGFNAKELKSAGFDAKTLKDAGYSTDDVQNAGYTDSKLKEAGIISTVAGLGAPTQSQGISSLGGMPTFPSGSQSINTAQEAPSSAQQLQAIINKQTQQMAEQKYQQKIQQRTSEMISAANQTIQEWKKPNVQVYVESTVEEKKENEALGQNQSEVGPSGYPQVTSPGMGGKSQEAIIKTGDILFAVLDTSVNSDEPGPILATIVSGKLKGTKLIGSFNLPPNSDKMVITFNTMSVPGAPKTTSISAYAVDPNTARTALSSRANHHYLMRYGSLFASTFIQGFGNAFQSANTTITIGGTGGGNNVTVSNGVGRSTLQNAVIGLATVGKAWAQQAQQLFSTPTTVELYSGTGMGILFTQDVSTI